MILVLILFLISIIMVSGFLSIAAAQSSSSGTNWLRICRTFDKLIDEPCETLTSPDGHQLTEQGRKVLICLLLGGAGKLLRFSDDELKSLAPVAGCDGTATPSQPTVPSQPSQIQPQPIEPPVSNMNITNITEFAGNATITEFVPAQPLVP